MFLNFLKDGILAALAAFTLLPGMACTYSATSRCRRRWQECRRYDYTQPGCAWTTETPRSGPFSGRFGRGTGSYYMYVGTTLAERDRPYCGATTVQSTKSGRSGSGVQIVFQSTLTQYGR